MFYLALTVITALVLFIGLGFTKKEWKRSPRQFLAFFALLWLIPACVAQVPTGHTGILTTFGKVEDMTLEAGVHFKLPYQDVVVMDNRTQISRTELYCFSSDIQEVKVNYSINYQIEKANAQLIYKTIGTNYYQTVMEPKLQVAVKGVIAKYDAEKLIASRDTLSAEITEILVSELADHNIVILSTSLEDLDFSDAFTQAVEDKQVAQQALLKAKTEQEQKTMEEEQQAARQVIAAEAAAEVAKIDANAKADVAKIEADAREYAGQKDAEINRAIAATLTPDLVEYFTIKQWDGKLPESYVGGVDSIIPVLKGAAQ